MIKFFEKLEKLLTPTKTYGGGSAEDWGDTMALVIIIALLYMVVFL